MSGFERGANPYPGHGIGQPAGPRPPLPVRVPGASMPVSMHGWQPPHPPEVLLRAAGAIRTVDSRPPLETGPVYESFLAARYGTGPQPQPTFTPKHAALPAPVPEAPAPLPVRDAIPDDGRLRGLLARMAATCADRAEPIFSDTCAHCKGAGGRCRHHQAMHEESAEFRRLALALGGADSDQDALLVLIAAAVDGAALGYPGSAL